MEEDQAQELARLLPDISNIMESSRKLDGLHDTTRSSDPPRWALPGYCIRQCLTKICHYKSHHKPRNRCGKYLAAVLLRDPGFLEGHNRTCFQKEKTFYSHKLHFGQPPAIKGMWNMYNYGLVKGCLLIYKALGEHQHRSDKSITLHLILSTSSSQRFL